MTARFLKRQLRVKWRQALQSSSASTPQLLSITADFLTVVFSQSSDSRAYWEKTIRPGLEQTFKIPSVAKYSALFGGKTLHDSVPHTLLLKRFKRGLFAFKNQTEKEQDIFFARQASSRLISFAASDIRTIYAHCKGGPISFPYIEDAKCSLQMISDAYFLPSDDLSVEFAVVELYKRALQNYDVASRVCPSDAYTFAKWGQAIVSMATSPFENLIARKALSEEWQLCRLFTASGKLSLALSCLGPQSSKPPTISSSAFLSARLALADVAQSVAEKAGGMNQSGGVIDKAYAFAYFQYVSLLEHYHPNQVTRHLSKAIEQHRPHVLRRRASISASGTNSSDSKSVAQLLASVTKCTENTAVVEIHRDAISDICSFFRCSSAMADELFWFHSIKGIERAIRVRNWPTSTLPPGAKGRPSASSNSSPQGPSPIDRLREQELKRQRRRSNSFSSSDMPRLDTEASGLALASQESDSISANGLSKSPSQRTIDLAVSKGTLTRRSGQQMSAALQALQPGDGAASPPPRAASPPPQRPNSPPGDRPKGLTRQTSTEVLRYAPRVNAHQLPEAAAPVSPLDRQVAVPKTAGAISVPPAPSIRKSRDVKAFLEINSIDTEAEKEQGSSSSADSLASPRQNNRKPSTNTGSAAKPPFDLFFRDPNSARASADAKAVAGERLERFCYASVSFTDAVSNTVKHTLSTLSQQINRAEANNRERTSSNDDNVGVRTFKPPDSSLQADLHRERASLSFSMLGDYTPSPNIVERRASDATSYKVENTQADSFVRSDDADLFEEYSHGIVATIEVGAHKILELGLLRFFLQNLPVALGSVMPNLVTENCAIIRALTSNPASLSAVAHNYQALAGETASYEEQRCLLQVAQSIYKECLDETTPSNIVYDYAVVSHDLAELMQTDAERLELLEVACKTYADAFERLPDTLNPASAPMATMRGNVSSALEFERKLEARASCLADWAAALGEIYNMQKDHAVQDEFASQMLDLILRAYQIFPRGQVKVRLAADLIHHSYKPFRLLFRFRKTC